MKTSGSSQTPRLARRKKWLKHGNACIRFGSNRAIEVNLPG